MSTFKGARLSEHAPLATEVVSRRNSSPHSVFSNLKLARKVALMPALTLLLMGMMLAVTVQKGNQSTDALRALDRDVFEPLNRAQSLRDDITLLHTRLFALLSVGNNEADPASQVAAAATFIVRLNTDIANFDRFLDESSVVPHSQATHLRDVFAGYATQARETADFAAYDGSYGAMLAGVTDEHFSRLHSELETLVQVLSQRRTVLTKDAVNSSRVAEERLLGAGLGAALLALVGSVVVGRSIARPVLRLIKAMSRLASGDTSESAPGAQRQDEVGAMARAVEVFRASAIARRENEVELRRINLQFDAALNSMLQGMIVWSPDHRVQLINRRFLQVCGLPARSVRPDMTLREVIDVSVLHGLHPGEDAQDVCSKVAIMLTTPRSMDIEVVMRPGLLMRIASQPMTNGGTVVTFEDVTEIRKNEQQIAFMAYHDVLTGLPNRTLFRKHLDAAINATRGSRNFAVLFLDLDHFKEVNDTLGHSTGDELLQLVAGRLRHCVRDSDIVARVGGDEFALVIANSAEGPVLAERLVEVLGAPYDVQGHALAISASIGIAVSGPGIEGAELLRRADIALYRAKDERGTFVVFHPDMEENLLARHGLEADLRLALHRGEFELYYQPIYNFGENRITSFEALMRWNSPTRGRVMPADFIPVAERTGLIVPMSEWALRTACAEAMAWPNHVRVAVNLSPVQFKNTHLVATVQETLEKTGLAANRLDLEITETILLQNTTSVMEILHGLHDLGVRVSMDDFGTGYSSLRYLHLFPFDKIKIDRSFINDLRGVPDHAASVAAPDVVLPSARSAATIVRTVIGLGRNLGMSTTAEGVETAEQFAHLCQDGCTEVQGYFISAPRPADEVEALRQRLDVALPKTVGRRSVFLRQVA